MAKEIERKFKVIPYLLPELEAGETILQGYLSEDPQVRFRVWKNSVVLGVKSPQSDGSRFELEGEKPCPTEEEIQTLCSLAKGRVIQKTRYPVVHEDLIWEVDVYTGENEGLITADVELPSLDWNISFPEWVDQEQELTHNKKYANINLAQNPYKHWGQS